MNRVTLQSVYLRLRGGNLTLGRLAGSVALGLFVGLLPLYGLHLPLCLGMSYWLGLDALIAYALANVSNPFLAPFIVLLELEVGSFVCTGRWLALSLAQPREIHWSSLTAHGLVGAFAVAVIGATLGALVTWGLGLLWRRTRFGARSPAMPAIRATNQRYARVRPQDRHYVRIKLAVDPLTRQLTGLPYHLGRVTDAGCGRGQFGVLLHELGKARSLYGFDWDPEKVASAAQAAGTAGTYVVGDLRSPPLMATDTVLLFDVLHYLDAPAQTELLRRVDACLVPGGRLLLRDVDRNRGPSATLTRLFEQVGTRLGMNRAEQLTFRPASAIRDELLALGFIPVRALASAGHQPQLLDNQLYVFEKPSDATRSAGSTSGSAGSASGSDNAGRSGLAGEESVMTRQEGAPSAHGQDEG